MVGDTSKPSRLLFRDDLITAIKSSPLIYIPHYHYGYVDEVLGEIFPKRPEEDNVVKEFPITGLYSDAIFEYDDQRGQVDFYSKNKLKSMTGITSLLQSLLAHDMANGEPCTVLKEHSIILLKNVVQMPLGGGAAQSVLDNPANQLALQTFVEKYEHGDYDPRTTIIMVSPAPVIFLPMELRDIVTVVDVKPPTIGEILEKVKEYPVSNIQGEELGRFQEELSNSLRGLHMFEVERILRSILVLASGRHLKRKSIRDALEEKRRIVKKSGIIEVIEANTSFDVVGGLEELKKDLQSKALLFRNLNEIQSKRINLPIPKGVLIIGMPGCGKTLIAKAVANEFGIPLLRLDVNRLMGQYVGMSEENLRRALQTAETANPCVLWIDEVEKAFAGAGAVGGESDMLVQRLMGQFLTWMQEHEAAVYIVATANDVMRPEFMRKGRFDEVYFVDFPNLKERKAILKNKMMRYGFLTKNETIYDFSEFMTNGKENDNFDKIAEMMVAVPKEKKATKNQFQNGFSGAEIESAVNQVMERVYRDYRIALDNKQPNPAPIKVAYQAFKDVIEAMKLSVMACQITSEEEKKKGRTTNIERIREMQQTYNFKEATKNSIK